MILPADKSNPAAAPPTVKSLKLEFSKAADYNRINALFDPSVKKTADPKGYVAKRLEPVFRKAVNDNRALFLSDENGNVQSLIVAYHHNKNDNAQAGASPDYTEIGSALSRLQGYGSSKMIIAALALKEWWNNPPREIIGANIEHSNVVSAKIFHGNLGWEPVKDDSLCEIWLGAVYKTITDDVNTGSKLPHSSEIRVHACIDQVLATQASVLLEYMRQGGVINKKTGDFIPVDFSALEQEGLNKARLEAIAQGVTARSQIAKINNP